MSDAAEYDVSAIARPNFPALSATDQIFMDNAGGSQIASQCIHKITAYLSESNVQLGASYTTSKLAKSRVSSGIEAARILVHAKSAGEIVLGSSTTQLLKNLAESMQIGGWIGRGDEIIVTNADHEANIGCWVNLANRSGASLKFWSVVHSQDDGEIKLDLDELKKLIGPRTRLVCFTNCSNVLGSIVDVKAVVNAVRELKSDLVIGVDGVAFAPHRAIDVQELGVDFYVFSLYKVFGPHISLLYAKEELIKKLGNINHFFLEHENPYKLIPGNVNYELTFSITGIVEYFENLYEKFSGKHVVSSHSQIRDRLNYVFNAISSHEENMCKKIIEFLNGYSDIVTIIGSKSWSKLQRVPTISFLVRGIKSQDFVEKLDSHGIGIRYGHFYAYRLIESLGIDLNEGVIRISFVHYNSILEIETLISKMEPILCDARRILP